MTPGDALHDIINPTLDYLAGFGPRAPKPSDAARALLLAIGLQESRLEHRDQIESARGDIITGPALGLWQFERGGGVRGVLRHPASEGMALRAVLERGYRPDAQAVWLALEHDDRLACVFARLLLWTDPKPLPLPLRDAATAQTAWDYYVRNWRPGKPHRETWDGFWDAAVSAVAAASRTETRPNV